MSGGILLDQEGWMKREWRPGKSQMERTVHRQETETDLSLVHLRSARLVPFGTGVLYFTFFLSFQPKFQFELHSFSSDIATKGTEGGI